MSKSNFKITRKIWVTFQRIGFHYYLNAPQDVDYLRMRHRHLFKFKVTVEVSHGNRAIEFHQFQTKLENLYNTGTLEMDHKSCEMMGEELINQILTLHPTLTFIEVEVSEDGECAGVTTYEKVNN